MFLPGPGAQAEADAKSVDHSGLARRGRIRATIGHHALAVRIVARGVTTADEAGHSETAQQLRDSIHAETFCTWRSSACATRTVAQRGSRAARRLTATCRVHAVLGTGDER